LSRALLIEEWEWDDGNLSELGRHGLTRRIVLQVAEEAPAFRRNRRGRSAVFQMIGPDRGSGFWTVCIAQAGPALPGRWRAVTGWASDADEIAWYRRTGRG
jgi:hypothetical protein